jgi:hypothetical protein
MILEALFDAAVILVGYYFSTRRRPPWERIKPRRPVQKSSQTTVKIVSGK